MTPRSGDQASPVAAEWVRTRIRTGEVPTSRSGTAVVLGDAAPDLACALEESGQAVTRWHRLAGTGQPCSPWPPRGLFGEAWVRLPRSSREAAMLLHAAAARVGNGGRVCLYGAGDEGIRSAARHFPAGTCRPRAALIKRRCRVLAATRRLPPPRPDGLDSWAIRAPVDWGTGTREWTFYPGVFACGRLDPATALLIERLPPIPAGARILDFGAGTGPLAAAALERAGPGAEAVLLDSDAISLAAAAINVPGATVVSGNRIAAVAGPFDLVVSNPPIRAGRIRGLGLRAVEALARDAPGALKRSGGLVVVAQRRLPVARLLARTFGDVGIAGDRGPFRVWTARHHLRPDAGDRSAVQPYRPSM